MILSIRPDTMIPGIMILTLTVPDFPSACPLAILIWAMEWDMAWAMEWAMEWAMAGRVIMIITVTILMAWDIVLTGTVTIVDSITDITVAIMVITCIIRITGLYITDPGALLRPTG